VLLSALTVFRMYYRHNWPIMMPVRT
jgi:hypothetical protein